MKASKLWMTVFLIPIFALLQIAVIYRYREAEKEEKLKNTKNTNKINP